MLRSMISIHLLVWNL